MRVDMGCHPPVLDVPFCTHRPFRRPQVPGAQTAAPSIINPVTDQTRATDGSAPDRPLLHQVWGERAPWSQDSDRMNQRNYLLQDFPVLKKPTYTEHPEGGTEQAVSQTWDQMFSLCATHKPRGHVVTES